MRADPEPAARDGPLGELLAIPRAELSLSLTLLALLLEPVGDAWTRPLFALFAGAGLLLAGLRAGALLWLALTALAAHRILSDWPVSDNHGFLLVYWCLAAALATLAGERDRILAWNGRALVALVFGFATLWKLFFSPDYLDGRFWVVTLVDDHRFEDAARLATGVSSEDLLALRDLVSEHVDGIRVPSDEAPVLPARLVAVARGLTFATLAIEASVALAFLAPARSLLGSARHALLLLFCVSTYAIAPVEGFAWLLLSMGVAQCEPERTRTRLAYACVFAFVLLAARWPWLRALADSVQPS
jgi:hypothetical protein